MYSKSVQYFRGSFVERFVLFLGVSFIGGSTVTYVCNYCCTVIVILINLDLIY